MTTRSLRDILHRTGQQDLGFTVCIAHDTPSPGGGIFIKAHTPLTERHLAWFEQRNPAGSKAPTYMEVLFHERQLPHSLKVPLPAAAEPLPTSQQRRTRADKGARKVAEHGGKVFDQTREIFRIVGDMAFPPSALRHPKVQANLQELDSRIRQFHSAAKEALDEYLTGNTLIMELITRHGLRSRELQHNLNTAVLATEIASAALLGTPEEANGLSIWPDKNELWETTDQDLRPQTETTGEGTREERISQVKRQLVEIFIGGFMHDCGLWNEVEVPEEGHEAAGARFVDNLTGITDLAPGMLPIVLFHSEVMRLANRKGIVQLTAQEGAAREMLFRREFYWTIEEARSAVHRRSGRFQAKILDDDTLSKVLPVALAEYFLTYSEGFYAQSPAAIIAKLAEPVHGGLYARFMTALCNARSIVPRRACFTLHGTIATRSQSAVNLTGYQGCSLGHGEDLYSPHLFVLFAPGTAGQQQKLDYVDPRDSSLWGRTVKPQKRIYIAAGRHENALGVVVDGFMPEELYVRLLGEYEQELRRQMQA